MRNLIKILIALAFIAGSLWVGKYIASEKYSSQLKEVNSKTETDTRLIQQLRDSINTLKSDLENEKSKSKIDTVIMKPNVKQK